MNTVTVISGCSILAIAMANTFVSYRVMKSACYEPQQNIYSVR